MLIGRADGRWEVQCPQCQRFGDQPRPIGIGMPIVNKAEAEGIFRNHAGPMSRTS